MTTREQQSRLLQEAATPRIESPFALREKAIRRFLHVNDMTTLEALCERISVSHENVLHIGYSNDLEFM